MSERINKIFSKISSSYDLMNHLLSFGVDISWRKKTVSEIIKMSDGADKLKILDIATGTGDLAISLSEEFAKYGKSAKIVGMDFNEDMLRIGRDKAAQKGTRIVFEKCDALHMPYENGSFDMLTSGFALRNFDDLSKFASESYRVLRKGGGFVFVDMAMPNEKSKRYFFEIYSLYMRFLGFFVDNGSYKWLVHSIKTFDKKGLQRKLKSVGFKEIKQLELTSGIGYIILGKKP